MSSRWSEDITFQFVTEYLKHECLWNCKSVLYRNRQARQTAYDEVEKCMGITGFSEKQIKLKIKNIRSTYSQELKKIKNSKKSGSGADTVYAPSIKWFQLLDAWLSNINSEMRQTQSNLTLSTEPSESDSVEEVYDSSNEDSVYLQNSNSKSITAIVPTENLQSHSIVTDHKKNKRQKLNEIKTMINQIQDISKTVNAPQLEENEFEVFGKNIGLQLKAMPLQSALEAQIQIQSFLSNFRLQMISDKNKETTIMPRTEQYNSQLDLTNSASPGDIDIADTLNIVHY